MRVLAADQRPEASLKSAQVEHSLHIAPGRAGIDPVGLCSPLQLGERDRSQALAASGEARESSHGVMSAHHHRLQRLLLVLPLKTALCRWLDDGKRDSSSLCYNDVQDFFLELEEWQPHRDKTLGTGLDHSCHVVVATRGGLHARHR